MWSCLKPWNWLIVTITTAITQILQRRDGGRKRRRIIGNYR